MELNPIRYHRRNLSQSDLALDALAMNGQLQLTAPSTSFDSFVNASHKPLLARQVGLTPCRRQLWKSIDGGTACLAHIKRHFILWILI